MKRLFFAPVLLVLFGIGSLPIQGGDQDDPKPPPPQKADKPAFGDRDDATLQNKRTLKVRNETETSITVFIQFRAPDASGAWSWIPGDPAKTSDALSFEIEAGKELDVAYKEEPLAASRMRIWATSEKQKWLKYKTKDVWLVPERTEEGEHVYMASGVETFSFVFSASPDKGVIPGDSDMPGEQNLPTEGENLPPPVVEIQWD
ncbi:MAG: hypothetical protein HYR84_01705, partial [Planctomycetes bacterium]|nr:hypothetical protein [Planctomycetota bacterium]